jgi:hypothetical protein
VHAVTYSQAGRLAAGCQARARELGSLPDWARQRARAAGYASATVA